MSRSRRKTPTVGITTAESDKRFKQAEHRRERRAVNSLDLSVSEATLPREFGNPGDSKKDGKQFLYRPSDPRLLRE